MDFQEAFDAGFDAVKAYVDHALAAHELRFAALEKQIAAIPAPKDVPDIALVERVFQSDVKALVGELRSEVKTLIPDVERIVAPIIAGAIKDYSATVKAPKDVEPQIADLRKKVEAIPPAPELPDIPAMINKAIAALPAAKDGADGSHGKDGAAGKDGIAPSLEEMEPLVKTVVSRFVESIPTPKDGKDGAPGKDGINGKDGSPGANGQHGKDADPEMIRSLVETAVAKIPVAKDGVDGKDADPAAIEKLIREGFEALPKPKDGVDGKSVTLADVAPIVTAAVSALPVPKDGQSVTVEDCLPVIEATVSKAVTALPKARDGVGLAGAIIDRTGNLIVTMTDGSTKELGRIEGRDGKDIDMDEVEKMISEKVAGLPKPRDGIDGIDGVGFDDMDFEVRDNGCYLTFTKGDVVKEWHTPIPIDQGVWALGKPYGKGAVVTYDGSAWISQDDANTDKPGTSKVWRLAVKKGRDRNDPVKIDG